MNGDFSVQELEYLANGLNQINQLNAQLQQTYAQIDASSRQIQYLENNMNNANSRLAGVKARDAVQRRKRFFRILIPLAIIGYLYHRFNIAIQNTTTATSLSDFLVAAALFLAIIVAIIYGLIRMLIGSARRTGDVRAKRTARENPAQIEAEQTRLQNLNRQLAPLDQKIKQVAGSISELYNRFPPDYRYAEAVERCAFYMRNQRAATVGAGLNLYVEELRHDEMMAEQRKQSRLLTENLMANIATAYHTGQMVKRMDVANEHLSAIQNNTARAANRLDNMDPTVNVYVKY